MTDIPESDLDCLHVPIELKERALMAAGEGITIVDARRPGMPLLYVNRAFEQLTGYSREEAIGFNCKFLQGPETDPKAGETIRDAIRDQRSCVVEILNYRKDGTTFWNRLSITPARDAQHEITHFIGIQSDVTARRLAEDALAAANREMRRDLQAAARIQRSLLPTAIPRLKDMELAWDYRPSTELGGDTLNILRLDHRTVAMYLLDVSGHGVPASLLSFTLAHTLSNLPEQSCLFDGVDGGWIPATPSTVATRLNQRFKLDPEAPQFFTMFYGLLDEPTRTLRYVLAGHPPLVLARSNGDVGFLFSNSPPVGLMEETEFPEQDLSLSPGDRLFAFTDGLNEAISPSGEELSFERIGEVALATRQQPLAAGVQALVSLAEEWTDGDLQDDVSVLAIACLR